MSAWSASRFRAVSFKVSPLVRLEVEALILITSALSRRAANSKLTRVRVLGTLDDDEMMVGAADTWPWTCYILAEVPDRGAVAAVCNLLRNTEVGDARLWKYLKVEARLGRPLFFAEQG